MIKTRDLNFFRRISMISAVLLVGITIMNHVMATDIIDIPFPRIMIAISLIALIAFSYYNRFIQAHYLSIYYVLVVIYISYAIFLSYANSFPIYDVSSTIMVAIALAVLFRSKKQLKIYLAIVYLEFLGLFFLCESPEIDSGYLIMSLSFLVSLAYFVLHGKIDAITSLTENKEALLRSETRLKNIFEHSPLGILLFDSELNILQANPISRHILGYSEAALKSLKPEQYIDANDLLTREVLLEKIKNSGNKAFVKEQRFIRKDGSKIWLRSTLEFMDELREGEACIISMIEDISFEKSARLKLKEYAKRLKTHNECLEEFSYVVSHDLQEPLRMIKSYSTLIQRKYLQQLENKEADIDIGYVLDGANRMSLLIRDMLNYSRWSAKPFKIEEVDSFEVLTEVVQNLSMSVQEKQAEIFCHNMPNLKTNRVLLSQIFQNIVGNGIKYSEENRKPSLKIFGKERAHDILFTVEDNGMGFNPKEKQRIFGLFQRLNPHGVNKGTGIGLAICKRIIEKQGGQIWANAELGKGSIFYFTLPKKNVASIEI